MKIENVQIDGGFSYHTGRDADARVFTLRIEDPTSGTKVGELEMTEAQFMDAITGAHRGTLGGTFTLYEKSLTRVGKWHAIADVVIPWSGSLKAVERQDRIAEYGRKLGPGEWTSHDRDGSNSHRWVRAGGTAGYRVSYSHYVEPNTDVAELTALADPGVDVEFRVLDPESRFR